MGEILTPEEAAAEWRLKAATVRSWIRKGLLKATRIGNQYRIQRKDWDEFIKSQEGATKKANGLAFSH